MVINSIYLLYFAILDILYTLTTKIFPHFPPEDLFLIEKSTFMEWNMMLSIRKLIKYLWKHTNMIMNHWNLQPLLTKCLFSANSVHSGHLFSYWIRGQMGAGRLKLCLRQDHQGFISSRALSHFSGLAVFRENQQLLVHLLTSPWINSLAFDPFSAAKCSHWRSGTRLRCGPGTCPVITALFADTTSLVS